MQLLEFHIKWMIVLGLWPKEKTGFLDVLHTSTIFSMQFMNLISGVTNLVQCNGKLNCTFENVTYTILTFSSLYTFVVFFFNKELYQKAATTLRNLMENFGSHDYTIRAEKVTKRVAIFSTLYCSLGLLEYNVAPLIDFENCLLRNSTDSALSCGLPTPGWFPFDCSSNPGLRIAYVLQVIWAVLCIKSVCQPLMLSASVTYHIIAHLYMVQNNLKDLEDSKQENRYEALTKIIRHHTAILDTEVSETFNQLLLMCAVMMALIISVSGFQIIQMLVTKIEFWNLWRYFFVLSGYGTALLILSILGQKLIDESIAISDYAYAISWYDEPVEFQKMVQLLILRANKPLALKCASISDVSFSSFSKVISTTYSYLAMMYKMLLVNDD